MIRILFLIICILLLSCENNMVNSRIVVSHYDGSKDTLMAQYNHLTDPPRIIGQCLFIGKEKMVACDVKTFSIIDLDVSSKIHNN